MNDEIIAEPVIGDAIVKKEIISYGQMYEEMLQENLLHNPEMSQEMKTKWNNERLKYFDEDKDEKIHFTHTEYIKLLKNLGYEDDDPAMQITCKCKPCNG